MSDAGGTNSPGVFLPWDSEFFGFRIGRANGARLDAAALTRLLAWSAEERLRCLYFFGDGNDRATLDQAHAGGFKFVDVRVELAVPLRNGAPTELPERVRVATAADLPALETIARAAHTDTRFSKDAGFPTDRAAELYARWIRRDFREHEVLAWDAPAGGAAGYVSCQLNAATRAGRIGLIGVAADLQGRGAGRTLVEGALRRFAQAGCTEARVVTQACNLAAQRLYQAHGFRTAETHATFHRWF